jgi:hypothetical protein
MKLFHPVANAGEQELLYLPLAVVEEFGVPTHMVASLSGMKVTVFGAVKLV